MKSLPPSLEGLDIALADRERLKAPSNPFARSILISLIFHSIFFYALIQGVHPVHPRPVKEVHHWVVNLVSEWSTEPRGLPRGNIEGASIAIPMEKIGEKMDFPLSGDNGESLHPTQATGDTEFLTAPQTHPALFVIPQENSPSLPETSGPQDRKMEKSLKVMKDQLGQGIQLGQFLYHMKIQEQFAFTQIKYFQKNLKAYLENTLQTLLTEEERRGLQGKKASARIDYSQHAEFPKVIMAEDSDSELAAFLMETMDWTSLSAPGRYGLPNKILLVHVTCTSAGGITVWVSLL